MLLNPRKPVRNASRPSSRIGHIFAPRSGFRLLTSQISTFNVLFRRAPKSRHTILIAISGDIVMYQPNRGILCGLASGWMCHRCTKIAPYYTDWNFGGCSRLHRHRTTTGGLALQAPNGRFVIRRLISDCSRSGPDPAPGASGLQMVALLLGALLATAADPAPTRPRGNLGSKRSLCY